MVLPLASRFCGLLSRSRRSSFALLGLFVSVTPPHFTVEQQLRSADTAIRKGRCARDELFVCWCHCDAVAAVLPAVRVRYSRLCEREAPVLAQASSLSNATSGNLSLRQAVEKDPLIKYAILLMSAASSRLTRLLTAQLRQINTEQAFWAFPLLLGAGWVLWPALDYEWKMELGLAPDPEAVVNRVQLEKEQRLAAKMKAGGGGGGGAQAAAEEEEEEEEEAAAAEEEEEEAAPVAAADEQEEEDVPAMEDGDAEEESSSEEEESEEEEAEEAPVPPLYLPTKADKLSPQDVWDNFTIKVRLFVSFFAALHFVFHYFFLFGDFYTPQTNLKKLHNYYSLLFSFSAFRLSGWTTMTTTMVCIICMHC